MDRIEGSIAVVTGAASGIGYGVARSLAGAGASVVLADIEGERLEKTAAELAEGGARVRSVVADVSSFEQVEALAERVHEWFGKVHILCNNAGVAAGGGPLWETSEADWSWVLGVNLMGIVHGIRAFVPRMLEHGEPGHVVNTSSILGLTTGGGSIYGVSKHAVTRLSEGLYCDLRERESALGVSVLCPGLVATRIVSSARNRPDGPPPKISPEALKAIAERRKAAQRHFLERGMPPEEVGERVIDAIRTDTFYVLTHPELIQGAKVRFDDVLAGRAPRGRRPTPEQAPQGDAP